MDNRKAAHAELDKFVKVFPVECRLFLQRRGGFSDWETFTRLFRDMVRGVNNRDAYKHLEAQLCFEINHPGCKSEDWEALLKSKTPEITDKELIHWCDTSWWGPYHVLEGDQNLCRPDFIIELAIEAVCDLMTRFEKKLNEEKTND